MRVKQGDNYPATGGFRDKRRMLFDILKTELASSTILYIGYSHGDSNWKHVWNELTEEFYPSPIPQSYRIAPNTDDLDREILQQMNVHTIDATLTQFVTLAQQTLSENRIDPIRIKNVRQRIPKGLIPAFEQNPAATARLLDSWEYVNEAPFQAQSNVREFLTGLMPNWSLIAQRRHFERDVEEPLFEVLLDFATREHPKQETVILLGSAGYGISTVLMSIAARLAEEGAGPVLMHRETQPIIQGDIEFAASIFQQSVIFVVDNASDYVTTLYEARERLKRIQKPGCFLLGERLNEWRSRGSRIRGMEFGIDPLSDNEIERLLKCLEMNKRYVSR